MRINSNWAAYLENGVVDNLLSVYAESEAELARYLEYLLLEKKWLTAQNMPSLTAMGKLISRKPRRPVSAAGFVVVSHSDKSNVKRLENLGRTFFNIDDASDYDNSDSPDTDVSGTKTEALTPWRYPKTYTVPEGTVFTSAGGVKFISTETVSIKYFDGSYATIKDDPEKYKEFIKNGGWNNIKYLKVPVIQGIQKTTTLGIASGERFETFNIPNLNIEDASHSMSQKFFYVEVTTNDTTNAAPKTERWEEISNIRLAGPYDKVFEVIPSDDLSQLSFKFGDGTSGKMLTADTKVVLHYLETMGADGNVDAKFQVTKMEFPNNYPMVDPRSGAVSDFLSCTNIYAIRGGKDAEDFDDYRLNAPTSYVKSYATATKKEYEEKIMKYSPVSLLRLKVFSGNNFVTNNIDTNISDIYCEVASEYTTIQNKFYVTALQSNGELIDDPDASFIEPVLKSMANQKSPNDSLEYLKPSLIKLGVGVTVTSASLDYSDDDIKETASQEILKRYSIFSQDFKEKFYLSDVIADIKKYAFSDTISVELTALADIDYDSISFIAIDSGKPLSADNAVIAIPFKFNKIFSQNAYLQGFKNYTVNSGYLLKVSVQFNSSVQADNNRIFFLFDNRVDQADETVSVEDGKILAISESKPVPTIKKIITTDFNYKINFCDESADSFNNRQVRVAQFKYSDIITEDTNLIKMKSFNQAPYEIRYYAVDSEGKAILYNGADTIPDNYEFESITTVDSSVGYAKNKEYINNVDILFTEDYDNIDSASYASGYLIFPPSYFNFDNTDIVDSEDAYRLAADRLKSMATIKVQARPKASDFYPEEWNEIVYVDSSDINVSVNRLLEDK